MSVQFIDEETEKLKQGRQLKEQLEALLPEGTKWALVLDKPGEGSIDFLTNQSVDTASQLLFGAYIAVATVQESERR